MTIASSGPFLQRNPFTLPRASSITDGSQVEQWGPNVQGNVLPVIGAGLTSIATTYGRRLMGTVATHSMVQEILLPANINPMPLEANPLPVLTPTPASATISQIVELSGMSRGEVAAKLLGVSRQSLWNWDTDGNIASKNLEKLTTILAILEAAAKSQRGAPDTKDLRWWLFTPRGESEVTPQELILNGEFSRARLLALTEAPRKRASSPEWLKGGSSSADSEMIQRILDSYSGHDYGPHRDSKSGGE